MDKRKFLTATGLAVGLSAFLISNANANPFKADLLKTGYENGNGAESKTTNGECGAGVCGDDTSDSKTEDGKCAEGQCGADKAADGKCGEGQCCADKTADGSCGGDKAQDGRCGMSGDGN